MRIVLATRTIDGKKLAANEVQTSEIGLLQIDDATDEIDILPVRFMDTPQACLTIADVISALAERPEIASFSLTGVDGFKELANGGHAQMTLPIIGTYTLADDNEIWLLQYPQEQWPQHWFAA